MPARKLPPLLAGGGFTCPASAPADFTPPDLERELKGETTAMLRVKLANEVGLEIPLRAYQMQMLMSALMRIFPNQAMANLRLREEQEKREQEEGCPRGARQS